MLADCYSEMGQTRAAARVLREATGVSGDTSLALDYAACLLKLGEYAEAEKRIGEVRGRTGAPEKTFRHEALLCALTGRQDEALALMKNETQSSRQISVAVYALLGQKARAIEGIRLASGSEGFRTYRWYPYSYLVLENNPFFDALRDDPAFRSIAGKAKALYEERARRFGAL